MTNEELAIKAKKGDKDALRCLYIANERIIYKLLQGYIGKAEQQLLEADDLQQSCYFAFLKALHYYDSEKPYRFSTYLSHHVKNTLNGILGKRYSRYKWQKFDTVSLDIPIDGLSDESVTVLDSIVDATANTEQAIEDMEISDTLKSELKALKPRAQRVLQMRYGLNMTFQEVGDRLGISKQAVQQTEAKALNQLREKLKGVIQ